jgi:hypothetical protein
VHTPQYATTSATNAAEANANRPDAKMQAPAS